MDDQHSFQSRVHEWILACFGPEIGADRIERNHRFIEEALELVQANGCTRSEAHQLVDYVFDRPAGDLPQEVGGVMNTLAALCTASGMDMAEAGETELARVWTKVEQIRAKQAAKPKHSPLPAQPAVAMFPIMDGTAVPWSLIAPYEDQAQQNHGQTLKQLAARGGLSICEAMAIMSRATFQKRPIANPTVEDWLDFLAERKGRAKARALSEAPLDADSA